MVWAQNPGAVTEVVRIPHLEGFTSTGAVSPDGKQIALVTVDGGTRTQPIASLNVVHLETGKLVKAMERCASQSLLEADRIALSPRGCLRASASGAIKTVSSVRTEGDRVLSSLSG